MINISVIGAGRIGQIHAQNLARHPDCNVTYVADIHQPSADALAKKINAGTSDVKHAIQSPDVDAVFICSATDTHYQYCLDAAKEGKAIFCEKPLDLDLKKAEAVRDYIKKKDILFALGFNRRFDPTFARLKKDINSIGDMEQIAIISRDPSPPPHDYVKGSGGLFKDMMIHDFDMARWLLPEEPSRLVVFGSALVDPEIIELGDIDSAMVMLETKGGVQCHITNSRRAVYGYDQRIEVFGSKGLLKAENQPINFLSSQDERGRNSSPISHFFLDRYKKAYINEANDFVDAVMGKNISLPDETDGIQALKLAQAAGQSLRTGKIIELNLN